MALRFRLQSAVLCCAVLHNLTSRRSKQASLSAVARHGTSARHSAKTNSSTGCRTGRASEAPRSSERPLVCLSSAGPDTSRGWRRFPQISFPNRADPTRPDQPRPAVCVSVGAEIRPESSSVKPAQPSSSPHTQLRRGEDG